MKKLSKDQVTLRDELVASLQKAKDDVIEALGAVVGATAEANSKIEAYNTVLGDASSFAEEVAGEIESYIDERSEKWHESDAAQTYADWFRAWQGVDFSDIYPLPDPDEPEMAHAEELESLDTSLPED